MANEPRITCVYLFTNGMIAVFDQNGEQMPKYQDTARNTDLVRQLLADAPEETEFHFSQWKAWDEQIPRSAWAERARGIIQ